MVAIAMVATCIVVEAHAVADGANRGGDDIARHTRARELTERALSAARDGNCMTGRELAREIHDLDLAVYRGELLTDPAIAACLSVGDVRSPTSSSPPGLADRRSPVIEPERRGPIFGAGVAMGTTVQFEGRLGWMLTPQVAVFGTAVTGGAVTDDGFSYRMWGAGARLWFLRSLFIDGRIGHGQSTLVRYGDEADLKRSGFGCLFEFGAEGLGSFFGAEAYVGLARVADEGAIFLGLGVTIY